MRCAAAVAASRQWWPLLTLVLKPSLRLVWTISSHALSVTSCYPGTKCKYAFLQRQACSDPSVPLLLAFSTLRNFDIP